METGRDADVRLGGGCLRGVHRNIDCLVSEATSHGRLFNVITKSPESDTAGETGRGLLRWLLQ